MKRLGWGFALVWLGCSSSSGSTIRLELRYEEEWGLSELEVSSAMRTSRVGAVREV